MKLFDQLKCVFQCICVVGVNTLTLYSTGLC